MRPAQLVLVLVLLMVSCSFSKSIEKLMKHRVKARAQSKNAVSALAKGDVSSCRTEGGSCIERTATNEASCNWKSGFCRGSAVCCIPKDDSLCTRIGGSCGPSASCVGDSETRSGLCLAPDSGSLKCCVPVYTHSAGAARLTQAGFDIVSSGNCNNKDNKHCTSLSSILRHTVDGMIDLKTRAQEDCSMDCNEWTITGATETGHANSHPYSHGLGFKFDVRPTTCLTAYLRTFAATGDWAWDNDHNIIIHNELDGNGAHWDLYFT